MRKRPMPGPHLRPTNAKPVMGPVLTMSRTSRPRKATNARRPIPCLADNQRIILFPMPQTRIRSVSAVMKVACATCHTIHAPKDPVLVKTSQPEVCYTCHVEQRAQMRRFSRHPIREGKVVCSNCHNPHGGPGSNLVKNTVNETCYQCHAEKRGPFLYEHQPVRESCTLCHDPHGSTQTRMLVQRPPFLCQSCHSSDGGHPSILRDASLLPPSTDLNNRFLLAKGCLNCHSQVHGSNHPSGMFFTR